MSKETDESGASSKEQKTAPQKERLGGALDPKLWGGIGGTALLTYIFTPLAMLGGTLTGGYVGYKAASKYDNPETPTRNKVRKGLAAAFGAVVGMGIVFGCAFLGGVIGGPIGALVGAAVGAAATYAITSNVTSKYSAEDAQKKVGVPEQVVAEHVKQRGKEQVQERVEGVRGAAKHVDAETRQSADRVAHKLHGVSAQLGGDSMPPSKRSNVDQHKH